jgi:hypothetical protein
VNIATNMSDDDDTGMAEFEYDEDAMAAFDAAVDEADAGEDAADAEEGAGASAEAAGMASPRAAAGGPIGSPREEAAARSSGIAHASSPAGLAAPLLPPGSVIATSHTSGLGRSDSYQTADADYVAVQMAARIAGLRETLDVSANDAFLLLHHFKWKPKVVEDRWFSDTDGVRRAVGLSAGPDPPPLPAEAATEASFMDAVTLDDVAWADADALPCGHWFGKDAWARHVATALGDAGSNPMESVALRCLQDGCNEVS